MVAAEAAITQAYRGEGGAEHGWRSHQVQRVGEEHSRVQQARL